MGTVNCIVCGSNVFEGKALKQEHRGTIYYFCCEQCEDTFIKEPNKHAGKAGIRSVNEIFT
jgi:YHS domain-containing protein